MEKIKYLIIFALLLALGLIYIQLDNYKKITNNLLNQNHTIIDNNKIYKRKIAVLENNITNYTNEIILLKKQIITLEQNITTLKNKNISLEENLSKKNRFVRDINYTIPISTYEYHNQKIEKIPNKYEQNKTDSNEDYGLSPSFNLEEKKIDGFEFEYKQTF